MALEYVGSHSMQSYTHNGIVQPMREWALFVFPLARHALLVEDFVTWIIVHDIAMQEEALVAPHEVWMPLKILVIVSQLFELLDKSRVRIVIAQNEMKLAAVMWRHEFPQPVGRGIDRFFHRAQC